MYNVHERIFDAPYERVGALIDRLASDRNDVWPRDRWLAGRREQSAVQAA